jgi:hypothetical protein
MVAVTSGHRRRPGRFPWNLQTFVRDWQLPIAFIQSINRLRLGR